MSRAGFTGISYPAQAATGGRADGARNYVLFNEEDLEITDHVRFRFAETPEEFDQTQQEAVAKKGIVSPNLNSASVKVVDVPKHDFTGTPKEALEKAKSWAEKNLIGVYNLDDNDTYQISKDAISKYLSATATTKSDNLGVHLAVLKKLPQVISESVDAEQHPDYKKQNGVRSSENGYNENALMLRLYSAVRIDDKTYRVKTTIREYKDVNASNVPHSYGVTKIELLGGSAANAENSTSNPLNNAPNNSISTAKLLKGVEKSYDKGKKLLDESENSSDRQLEADELSDSGVRFRIGNARREEYKTILDKLRPDLAEKDKVKETIDNIEAFGEEFSLTPDNPQKGNQKLEKLALHWVANSGVILPEDNYKIVDAAKLAEKHKLDPMSFANPTEILNMYPGEIKEKATDPDTVKEFSNKQVLDNGVTVYDVEDTKEAQAAVRKVIDTHWGEDHNPWCLAARIDGNLDRAWEYWNKYNAYQKQISFQNGKLLAFSANEIDEDKFDRETYLEDKEIYINDRKEDAWIEAQAEADEEIRNKYDILSADGVEVYLMYDDAPSIEDGEDILEEYAQEHGTEFGYEEGEATADDIVGEINDEYNSLVDEYYKDRLDALAEEFDREHKKDYAEHSKVWWDKQNKKHDEIPAKSDGVKFRITAKEDAAYMEAVNSGDMETAQRMVNEAAAQWMGLGQNAEVQAMQERVKSWLSAENLEWANGKTRDEILEHFGNNPQAMAYIPIEYVSLLGEDITDNRVYSGMGYFIDHAVNHHPKTNKEKYDNIQEVLSNPDEVKAITDKGNNSIVFVKKIDRFNAVIIEVEKTNDGKIIWHKTFLDQKQKPYANKGTRLFEKSLEGGISSIIRTDKSAHGSSLSVLNDNAKVQNFLIPNANASKVVDENGEPLVVYHGTGSKFTVFDKGQTNKSSGNYGFYGHGFYLTGIRGNADWYAKQAARQEYLNNPYSGIKDMSEYELKNAKIIDTYLNIKNPLYWDEINTLDKAQALSKEIGMKLDFSSYGLQ